MPQRHYTYQPAAPANPPPQPVGRPKTIDQNYLDRLKHLVSHSPKVFGYSFHRWTAYWLRQHLLAEFQVAVSERHINRLLRQMGLSTRQRIQICQGTPSYRHRIEITDLSQEYLNQVNRDPLA
jgi:Winged helix-turn helix